MAHNYKIEQQTTVCNVMLNLEQQARSQGGFGGFERPPPQLDNYGPQDNYIVALHTAAMIVNDIHSQSEHNHTLSTQLHCKYSGFFM